MSFAPESSQKLLEILMLSAKFAKKCKFSTIFSRFAKMFRA